MTGPDAATGSHRFATASEGIAAEHALLQAARDGQHGALVWGAERPGLVVPRAMSRRPGFAAAARASAARGWPVHLRATGGGMAPQGPGIVNLSRAGPALGRSAEAIYQDLCNTVGAALATLGITTETGPLPGSFCDGRWNLLAEGRKIAGTAQHWQPRADPHSGWAVLAHAVILDEAMPEACLAAIDGLSADLNLPPTLGPRAHTTVAAQRAADSGATLCEVLGGIGALAALGQPLPVAR
ncbi:hypothetical protein U879_14185 [Defluviimonas sp. 20V17]|uniref:BPL/LPL catalytic domain-containing protein n=1 Tax=Allgaiera indica TaxID=765699 RepID=A0AAN4UNB7_9RHOB|nr:hypothetical protein [Allgaiera indica]KDB03007.1 hypothetical protein U879_14185 [Defluviimonas sp. 20V17]GHD98625.1 hypothetical protein GCM10008024_02890 [Allgaiera indica]SDW09750.1 hypothetical protein SAMN05444006_101262 [Allgaiera indica]